MKHLTIAAVTAMSTLTTLVAQPTFSRTHSVNHANVVIQSGHLELQGDTRCCCGATSSVQTAFVPGRGLGLQLQAVSTSQSCSSFAEAFIANLPFKMNKWFRFTLTPVGTGFNPSNFEVIVSYFPPGSNQEQFLELTIANGGIQNNGFGSYKIRTVGTPSIPLGSTIEDVEFFMDADCSGASTQTAFLSNVAIDAANVGVLHNESSICSGGCAN